MFLFFFFFFQAEDGIRDLIVTGVQTCALPISERDDAAIRRLLRANPMRGKVSLTFEREPDYFQSSGIADAEDQTIVAFDGEKLVCMGRASVRRLYLNGHPRRVGYLSELRLDHSAQGRSGILQRGYQFFR